MLSPVEWFTALIACLSRVVIARSAGEQLSNQLLVLIVERLRGLKRHFIRIAVSVGNGTYAPRRSAPRQFGPPRPSLRRPRQPSRLPPQTLGWLVKLVPEAVARLRELSPEYRKVAIGN